MKSFTNANPRDLAHAVTLIKQGQANSRSVAANRRRWTQVRKAPASTGGVRTSRTMAGAAWPALRRRFRHHSMGGRRAKSVTMASAAAPRDRSWPRSRGHSQTHPANGT